MMVCTLEKTKRDIGSEKLLTPGLNYMMFCTMMGDINSFNSLRIGALDSCNCWSAFLTRRHR
jgi:hypothetical protein